MFVVIFRAQARDRLSRLEIVRDERTIARLAELLARNVLPADIAERAAAIVKEAEAVAA